MTMQAMAINTDAAPTNSRLLSMRSMIAPAGVCAMRLPMLMADIAMPTRAGSQCKVDAR